MQANVSIAVGIVRGLVPAETLTTIPSGDTQALGGERSRGRYRRCDPPVAADVPLGKDRLNSPGPADDHQEYHSAEAKSEYQDVSLANLSGVEGFL